ncbi:MAG: MBL fold metallo-hydrolase [Acidimicrobiales bacterium]
MATLPYDPKAIDAVVITHAHIDHIGYLLSSSNSLRGQVYCTQATADLAAIVLPRTVVTYRR